MKLSMMTLGCPNWDLLTILKRAAEYGFHAVDFRGIQDILDITVHPAFTQHLATTRRMIADHGLKVSCISSSLSVCNPEKLQSNLEEAKRTVGLARELDVPYVRVFGGSVVEKIGREAGVLAGLDCMNQILAMEGATSVRWVFETHDDWMRGADCRLLLDGIANPAFGCLWDTGHTFRVAKEPPEETYRLIGERVHYVHVKDAVHEPGHKDAGKDGWRYVAPGTGVLPLERSIRILQEHGYEGYLVFEHEKRWHKTLPEPEEIFPQFVKWARGLGVVEG